VVFDADVVVGIGAGVGVGAGASARGDEGAGSLKDLSGDHEMDTEDSGDMETKAGSRKRK